MINVKEGFNTSVVVPKEYILKKVDTYPTTYPKVQWAGVDHAAPNSFTAFSSPPMASGADKTKLK